MENNRRSFKLLHYFCLIFVILFGAIAIISSGGGGGGGDGDDDGDDGGDDSTTEYATITGTVAGTTVVVVDENLEEVGRNTAAGTPKTFTLTVPASMIYSFYFIENEGTAYERIYPLYQGDANQFDITTDVIIDLGFVDFSSGVAVPENNPLNVSGVLAFGGNTTIPSSLAGSAFTTADLQGTWHAGILTSGIYPDSLKGWCNWEMVIDSSGLADISMSYSDGGTGNHETSFAIGPSGLVTTAMFSNFNGIMSIGKNLIIATATPIEDTGERYMIIAQKIETATYDKPADLQGTAWNYHMITTAGTAEGWVHGTISGDDLDFIGSGGFVTADSFTDFNGFMSADKSLIVATADDAGGGYSLIVFQKSGSSTFATSDLQGTWNGHSLVVGSTPSDPVGWEYQSYTIDAGGYITNMSVTDSAGNSDVITSSLGPLAIDSSGKISTDFVDNYDGILSLDKNLMVCTYDDDVGKHLMIGQK